MGGLHFPEFAKGAVGDFGAFFNLGERKCLFYQVGAQYLLHFFKRGEADEGVASADVEVKVSSEAGVY